MYILSKVFSYSIFNTRIQWVLKKTPKSLQTHDLIYWLVQLTWWNTETQSTSVFWVELRVNMENKFHVNDVELYLSKNTDHTLSTN